jgi:hypothetical protein
MLVVRLASALAARAALRSVLDPADSARAVAWSCPTGVALARTPSRSATSASWARTTQRSIASPSSRPIGRACSGTSQTPPDEAACRHRASYGRHQRPQQPLTLSSPPNLTTVTASRFEPASRHRLATSMYSPCITTPHACPTARRSPASTPVNPSPLNPPRRPLSHALPRLTCFSDRGLSKRDDAPFKLLLKRVRRQAAFNPASLHPGPQQS